MVAYSFKAQFVGPIRAGTKCQTIRAIGKRRHARPCEALQLYRGMRTKQCELIARRVCVWVNPIEIHFRDTIRKDWVAIHLGVTARLKFDRPDQLNDFAKRDGFVCWDELRDFWAKNHPGVRDFNGMLIEWHP